MLKSSEPPKRLEAAATLSHLKPPDPAAVPVLNPGAQGRYPGGPRLGGVSVGPVRETAARSGLAGAVRCGQVRPRRGREALEAIAHWETVNPRGVIGRSQPQEVRSAACLNDSTSTPGHFAALWAHARKKGRAPRVSNYPGRPGLTPPRSDPKRPRSNSEGWGLFERLRRKLSPRRRRGRSRTHRRCGRERERGRSPCGNEC